MSIHDVCCMHPVPVQPREKHMCRIFIISVIPSMRTCVCIPRRARCRGWPLGQRHPDGGQLTEVGACDVWELNGPQGGAERARGGTERAKGVQQNGPLAREQDLMSVHAVKVVGGGCGMPLAARARSPAQVSKCRLAQAWHAMQLRQEGSDRKRHRDF